SLASSGFCSAAGASVLSGASDAPVTMRRTASRHCNSGRRGENTAPSQRWRAGAPCPHRAAQAFDSKIHLAADGTANCVSLTAFTLIELLVVIAIIGILAALLLPA